MDSGKVTKMKPLSSAVVSLSGFKVLFAEDDLMSTIIVQKILSDWNVECAIAKNGLIAVEMVKKKPFDIILMDVQMPEMDGLTASKEIRKFNPEIPIAVLSSSISPKIQESFNNASVTDFLAKPIDQDSLYRVLVKYASRKG